MSRSDQPMGLSSRAQKFLEDNRKETSENCSCPDCKTKHVKNPVITWCGKYTGMFDDDIHYIDIP